MLLKTTRKGLPTDDDFGLPIPTQIVSNGEFVPVPQTRIQRVVEQVTLRMAEDGARERGMSRRGFLGSAMGTATALSALNLVHGCKRDEGFAMDACATRDPEAARELLAPGFFILDSQTHHVDVDPDSAAPLVDIYGFLRGCPPEQFLADPDCHPGELGELSRANYIKEIFFDSETTVAMMSGLPSPVSDAVPISNDGMAETCRVVNELGASQRCILQGMLTPNIPDGAANTGDLGTKISDIQRLAEELGIRALKTYTGAGGPDSSMLFPLYPGWRLDDEEVAYPMYEEALRYGIDVVNTHKGFAQGIFDPAFVGPDDIPKAARDWPQIRFVVFHSAVDRRPSPITSTS